MNRASAGLISGDDFSFNADGATLDSTSGAWDSVEATVGVAATAVGDGVQVAYAAIAGTSYEFAVMDQVAPTLSTYSPYRVAAGVSAAGNLMFSFSETRQVGSMGVLRGRNPTGSASTVRIPLDECSVNADGAT